MRRPTMSACERRLDPANLSRSQCRLWQHQQPSQHPRGISQLLQDYPRQLSGSYVAARQAWPMQLASHGVSGGKRAWCSW